MRLGMILRFDNSGLGTLSWEFSRHLKPVKALLVSNGVYQTFPERYKDIPNHVANKSGFAQSDIDWLLDGIDVLVTFETFYDWNVVAEAKRRGTKTVLVTMFEMTPVRLPAMPDLFLCPSTLDLKVFKERYPESPSEFLPIPIATDRLHWKKRTTAKTFIHTASHGGMNGRKGTGLLIEAMKYVKAQDIKVRIFSWGQYQCDDPRVSVETRNFQNYWQAWREGDVLIYPQGANGICLPIIEAMSSGMGVLTTNIYPFNEFMPKRLLFDPSGFKRTRFGNNLIEVEDPVLDPRVLASKIDQVSNMNISEESLYGKEFALNNSWEKLKASYDNLFNRL